MWTKAADTNSGYVVLEDDVITHPGLGKFAAALATSAPRLEWAAFAVNTDSVLIAQSPQGYVQTMKFQDKHPPPQRIAALLKRTRIVDVKLWRLLRGFGSAAYYVSPAGARKLLASVLPMRSDTVPVPTLGNVAGRVDRQAIERGVRSHARMCDIAVLGLDTEHGLDHEGLRTRALRIGRDFGKQAK